MKSQWVVLNSVIERDHDAMPDFPWYPSLFADDGSSLGSLNVSFATIEECRQFIKDHVLGAILEDE